MGGGIKIRYVFDKLSTLDGSPNHQQPTE